MMAAEATTDHHPTGREVNRDLLWFNMNTPLWFWAAVAVLGLLVGAWFVTIGLLIVYGLGLLGYNRPIMWSVLITTFVFWVGISHAGVMISAILRLTQAEWRRPVTRAAEVLTVFSLAMAATFPVVHTGRLWRTLYWVFPYDFWRGIWPSVRSPLVWDPSAIFTYLFGSSLFVYVALLPDVAVARDRSTGIMHRLYSIAALGFRGTERQWRLQAIAGVLLSALMLAVFVSVHSIVSWDFAVSLVPTWHSTIFAPYFVIGAVHSGVAAVISMMVILRKALRLQRYVTPDFFDMIGRLMVVVATTWLYFFLIDWAFRFYSGEEEEIAVMEFLFFRWPYNLLTVIFFLTAYIIPVPLWLFSRVRRNPAAMLWTSLLVNVGMWLERYMIIVPGLALKQPFTFSWQDYRLQFPEYVLVIGSLAIVMLGFLLFSKIFPIIPVYDIKEGLHLRTEIKVGRTKVPAVIRE